ncbi:MAG TPA: enterotoxin [Candidatus Sulfotelmatobacter sp.]
MMNSGNLIHNVVSSAKVSLLRTIRRGVFAALLTGQLALAQAVLLPDYGPAHASDQAGVITLRNDAIEASWRIAAGRLQPVKMTDKLTSNPIPVYDRLFALTIDGGGLILGSSMHVMATPRIEKLTGKPDASRLSERIDGQQLSVELEDSAKTLHATWRATLRDGTNYMRQQVTLRALNADLHVSTVRLMDLVVPGAQVAGAVRGSPVVAGNIFFGFEHPISESRVTANRVVCWIERGLPLRAGQSVTYSSVVGVTPQGQLRRGFLSYIEHERAHPYRPFLHYNSWFDLRYPGNPNQPGTLDEAGALDAIYTYGTELVEKRGVKVDSFLFDDGWDDNTTLWHFHSGFPNGFTPLREAAAKYGASPGVWLSPWGGYGEAREKRMKYGKEQGFEMNQDGFALSGPKYFARFREISLEFINKYGINQFKIDGTGNVNSAIPGSEFDSDFYAAISLINEWRNVKPDIYVNLTSGTYPSPFWLLYADSTWRGGDDTNFAGVGSYRERWITYRDADTFQRVVQGGPLYPLNSIMVHGIVYARYANHLETDPGNDFENEVHSYFGSGTQLQETYLTGSSLQDHDWDVLAESAKWSRENASVLLDSHWIGGDPAMLEVYGWASWSPDKGILVLRNPSDKPQDFTLDVAEAFELPAAAEKSTAKTTAKTTAPTTTAAKTAGAKAKTSASKTPAAKPGTAKTETAKTETAKTGTAKTGAAKTGTAKTGAAKTGASKTAAPKTATTKPGPAKTTAPKTSAAKTAAAKTAAAKTAASKTAAARAATSETFKAHSPWEKDTRQPSLKLTAGQPHKFHLEPFQVLTLEAIPQ